MSKDHAAFATQFWRAHRLSQGDREQRLQAQTDTAADEVVQCIEEDPDAALELLDALISDEQADLAYFGAGPVEDLLVQHGPRVADAIADRCRRSVRWATAVRGVWLDEAERVSVSQLHEWLPVRREP